MKEATGELNMTVITVVAVAAIAAFFYAFVWPNLKNNITNAQKCANAICPDTCQAGKACKCTYINESGQGATVNCVIKDNK